MSMRAFQDCRSLAISLQDLSISIQELAADPSNFVLHRTQCCSLAKSYALAVQHVTQQLDHKIFTCLNSPAHQDLLPSLLELRHAMLQGRKLLQDCLYRDGWVKKAVVLALSTEAEDVCLHDLVWCLCVIQQAMGQMVLQDDEPESSVYGSLNAVWAETSQKEDLDVLLGVLQCDIACWELQLSDVNLSTISRTELDAQCCLAKFLFKKLSRESHCDYTKAPWDALPWADPHEFSIKEVIGHGGFAVVYEVQWHGEIYGQKEFFGVDRDVFAREAAIQARLRHPNLLQLICCTSKPSKNRCSLVMELMDMDLRSMINSRMKDGSNPPFSLVTCVDLMLQIAKGMEHLHSLHIMHRDLKSLNLLVSNQPSIVDGMSSDFRMRVKIADFGMSKAKNQSSEYTTPHAGTTYWRAPEVFDVNPESEFEEKITAKYTKKADVYSFAMVCYEIVSGSIPFDNGGKLAKLHQRLLKGERPELPSNCPPYLVSYIEKCWHGDPEQRPTFAQISRTLRHLKGILLTSADPRTPLALSTRSCTRIEDKLEQMMGSQWPSTVSPWFSTRSMTISFEMSWYKVMECKLTKHEVARFVEMPASRMMQSLSLSASDNLDHNRMIKCQSPNLKLCIGMTLSWCWMGLCCWMGICCVWRRRKRFVLSTAQTSDNLDHNRMIKCQCPSLTLCIGMTLSSCWRGLCCWMGICCVWRRRRRSGSSMALERRSSVLRVFTYSELAQATNHFNASAVLGVGGSGRVYKGTFPDGQVVAVKVLSATSRSVDHGVSNELDLVSRVFHPNLVRLLGYCCDEGSLMLIYQFMPRGDLGQYLYGQKQAMGLTWAQRYNIACGIASALDYLHNGIDHRILHRDVKPSNILLDADFNAHLTDFGIALIQGKKGVDEDIRAVKGTVGYMEPDYLYTRQLGPEVDVYSFGVVLLQLASGRRFLEDDHITVVRYVWRLYKQGKHLDAVDERVRVAGHHDAEDEMNRLLLLGLMCCQSKRKDRPSMSDVVRILFREGEEPVLPPDMEIFH